MTQIAAFMMMNRNTMGRLRTKSRSQARTTKLGGTWLQSLHIRNFRGIRELEVTGLAPITVFTGDNGSGKTTLLDAAFAVYSRMNPSWLARFGAAHGIRGTIPSGPSYFGLFYGFSDLGEAVITSNCKNGSQIGTRIKRSSDVGSVVVTKDRDIDAQIQAVPVVVCEALAGKKVVRQSKVRWRVLGDSQGKLDIENSEDLPQRAIVLRPIQVPADEDDEQRFGDIKGQPERYRSFIDTLKRINPAVEDVDFLRTTAEQCFRVRLGDGQSVPLGMLGGGMNNLFKYLVYLETARDGFLAIDEAEQGFYHRRQVNVFRDLFAARKATNVQLMLATHSAEALAAIVEAVPTEELNDLSVIHLRREENDDVRATVIPGPRVKTSLVHGYDLR